MKSREIISNYLLCDWLINVFSLEDESHEVAVWDTADFSLLQSNIHSTKLNLLLLTSVPVAVDTSYAPWTVAGLYAK